MDIFLYFIIFYLIGCIPSGLVIAKFYNIKIQNIGSGNSGATNVARVIGKKAGLITLFMDILKGITAMYISSIISDDFLFNSLSGFFCVLGHCFGIPFLFKGGKGVATSLGVLAILDYRLAVLAILTFIAVFLYSKIVSLSSISSAGVILLSCLIYFSWISPGYSIVMCISLLIIFRHNTNIRKLLNGEEKQFKTASGSK